MKRLALRKGRVRDFIPAVVDTSIEPLVVNRVANTVLSLDAAMQDLVGEEIVALAVLILLGLAVIDAIPR